MIKGIDLEITLDYQGCSNPVTKVIKTKKLLEESLTNIKFVKSLMNIWLKGATIMNEKAERWNGNSPPPIVYFEDRGRGPWAKKCGQALQSLKGIS